MARTSGTKGRVLPGIGWIFVILLIPSVLYIANVLQQIRETDIWYQRLLDRAAQKIEQTLEDGILKTVGSLRNKPDFIGEFQVQQPYLDEIGTRIDGEDIDEDTLDRKEVVFLKKGSSLLVATRLPTAKDENGKPVVDELSVESPPPSLFEVRLDRILDEFPFDNRFGTSRLPDNVPTDDTIAAGNTLPNQGAFDHVILADGAGRVVYQSGRPGLIVTRLGQLQEPVDFEIDPDAPLTLPPSLDELLRSTQLRTVKMAGARYRLASQPIKVPAFAGELVPGGVSQMAPDTWILIGLIDTERTFRDALTVAPQLAFALLLLLIMGVLSWPILKLFWLNRRERLSFIDAYLILLSTFALVLLASILILALDNVFHLRSQITASLEELADEVEESFQGELKNLHGQLAEYDDHLSRNFPRSQLDQREAVMLLDSAPERSGESQLGLESPKKYRYFSSVFWTDKTGMQFAKGTIRADNTPKVRIHHREYIRAILEGRAWELPEGFETTGREGGFWYQTYRSVTTGARGSALSISSRIKNSGESDVAAITAQPSSVMSPVVSHGFGFAIINGNGTVMFHSDGRRALEGDLFEEVSKSERLRSAMLSRSDRHFDSRYLTRPCRMYVHPLSGLPWWVVTFHDTEVVWTASLEAVSLAFLFALIYLFIFNLPLAIYVIASQHHIDWLWPDPSGRLVYRRLTIFHMAFGLVFSIVVFGHSSMGVSRTALPWISFVLPMLASLVSATFLLRKSRSFGRFGKAHDLELATPSSGFRLLQVGRRGFLGWHVAAATSLWLIIAILPAIGFFRSAWQDQIALLVKSDAIASADMLSKRAARIHLSKDFDFFDDYPTPEVREDYLDDLWERRDDIFFLTNYLGASLAGPDREETPGSGLASSWFTDSISGFMPMYSRTSMRLRYLHESRSTYGRLAWRLGSDGTAIVFNASDVPFDRAFSIEYPSDVLDSRIGWSSLVGLPLLVLLVALWAKFSALRIFFGRIAHHTTPVATSGIVERAATTCVIAIVASPYDRRVLLTSQDVERIDIGGTDREACETRVEVLKSSIGKPVVCDGFETMLSNSEMREWKIRQLEELVFGGNRKVILPTALNPFEDLFWFDRVSGCPDGESDSLGDSPTGITGSSRAIRLDEEEARRWGRLLSEFVVVTVGLAPLEKSARVDPDEELTEAERSESPRQFMDMWKVRELDSTSGLHPIIKLLPERLTGLARRESLERIIETYEGSYWALWTACSAEEQLTLVHLAQEKIVNPKRAHTVRRLLQRGLVVRDPVLRIFNESFALFVLRIHEPLEIKRWEREIQGVGWRQFRWAFFGLLAVVALFVFATQQSLFEATVGFISALAVGIPGAVKFLGTMYKTGGRPTPSS